MRRAPRVKQEDENDDADDDHLFDEAVLGRSVLTDSSIELGAIVGLTTISTPSGKALFWISLEAALPSRPVDDGERVFRP